jgi:hypothetical protein
MEGELSGVGCIAASTDGERCVTKAEAVAYLTSRGVHAFERDWAMGETIGLAAGPTMGGAITVYRYVVYLERRGEGWIVEQLNPLDTDPQQRAVNVVTLENACAQGRSDTFRSAVPIPTSAPRPGPVLEGGKLSANESRITAEESIVGKGSVFAVAF